MEPLPGPVPPAGRSSCRYCGAEHNPFFYFCTACATPWRDIESVVLPASPPVLSEGERIRNQAPSVEPLFWTYLGVVLCASIVAEIAFQESRPDLKFLFVCTCLFVATGVFAAVYRQTLVAQLRRVGFDRPWAWGCLAILAPALLVNHLYHGLLFRAGAEDAMPLARLRAAGLSEGALVVLFCVYPAVTEEIAFRGLLQHWLQVAIRPERALALSAFLFAALHFSILSLPYLFGIGLLLGFAKWKTGSLYPSMLIHFLHNLAAIELLEPLR